VLAEDAGDALAVGIGGAEGRPTIVHETSC
jgi:hypothetical protein